jgi:hypothetical protein
VAGKVDPVFVDDVADLPAADARSSAQRRRGHRDGRGLDRRGAGKASSNWLEARHEA